MNKKIVISQPGKTTFAAGVGWGLSQIVTTVIACCVALVLGILLLAAIVAFFVLMPLPH